MARESPHERQANGDVRRAIELMARMRGMTDAQCITALGRRAVHDGISLHAAALAVLADDPIDELLTGESCSPAGMRRGTTARQAERAP